MSNRKKVCENMDKPYSFISYSHEDADKVYPIIEELNRNGYRIWYDRCIEDGTKWGDYIYRWLTHENCKKFIIFISRYSIESENVQDEVHIARKYRKSCLVIYLEDIQLSGGMELQLDRWQSINWYAESESIMMKRLLKGIPADTIELFPNIKEDSEFHKKYQLLEVIGKGGSSTVYKARMNSTDAIVTVKVPNFNVKENTNYNYVIENEKKVLSLINCPFIPKIIDFGVDTFDKELRSYLVESYIDGESLAGIRCPLNESEVVMIILDIAETLRYLHTNGNNLVHTDIKPANIMIDQFNKTYLIDFGCCVYENTSVRWGTKTFASPEQNEGLKLDIRSDIYSLGMTMKYLLLKDQLSIQGVAFKEVVHKQIYEIQSKTNYMLALIVEKMTDERIEKRFQTLDELISTLMEYQQKNVERPELILKKNSYYKDLNTYRTGMISENTENIKTDIGTAGDKQLRNDLMKLVKLPEIKLQQTGILDLSVSYVTVIK